MIDRPIQTLVEAIGAEFARDPRGPGVQGLLADYVGRHEDWRDYVNFRPEKYTRNLVGLDDTFELLVLCWNPGQETPIHNHEGQHCWMAVLEGEVEEVHFSFPDREAAPPREARTFTYAPGSVAYIHDDIGLHLIRPSRTHRCISLHLYSLPFRECNIYCAGTGRVSRERLKYDTVDGSPVAA